MASAADAGICACLLVRDGPGSAHNTAVAAHTGASHSAGGLYPGPFGCIQTKTSAGVLDFNAQGFANTLQPEILDVLAFDAQSSPTRCRP